MCSTGQIVGGVGGFLIGGPTGALIGYQAGTAYDVHEAGKKQEEQIKQAQRQAKMAQDALLAKQEKKRTQQTQIDAARAAATRRQTPAAAPLGGATGAGGVQDVLLSLGKTKLGA